MQPQNLCMWFMGGGGEGGCQWDNCMVVGGIWC